MLFLCKNVLVYGMMKFKTEADNFEIASFYYINAEFIFLVVFFGIAFY